MVTAQLRYSGLLETVRIRKEGFPVRLPFQVFIDRYLGLVLPELCRPLPAPHGPRNSQPRQNRAGHAQLLRLYTTQDHHILAVTWQIYLLLCIFHSSIMYVLIPKRSDS